MHYSKGFIKIEKYEGAFENDRWIPVGLPVETVEKKNGLSLARHFSFGGNYTNYSPYILSASSYQATDYPLKIFISEVSAEAPAYDPGGVPVATNTSWSVVSSLVTYGEELLDWSYEDREEIDNTMKLTVKYRFSPNINKTRKIRCVGLVKNNITRLDFPFEQTSTQILDVLYTVIVDLGSVEGKFKRAEKQLRKDYVLQSISSSTPSSSMHLPEDILLVAHTNVNDRWKAASVYGTGLTDDILWTDRIGVSRNDPGSSITNNYIAIEDGVYGTSGMSYGTLSDPSGILIGTALIGNAGNHGNIHNQLSVKGEIPNTVYNLTDYFYINDSNHGTAIQNTFPRTQASLLPYQDIDALANGGGSITINDSTSLKPVGSGWTGNVDGFAKKYRTVIKNSGEVGTSTYNVKSRNWFGTLNNEHRLRPVEMMNMNTEYANATPRVGRYNSTLPFIQDSDFGYHGQYPYTVSMEKQSYSDFANNKVSGYVQYCYPEFISFDRTGITINSIVASGINIEFGSISQVIAKKTGEIYVADLSGGLYKIERSIGSTTYTKTKLSVSGAANDTICRGVQMKKDGTLWAIFDQELCSSSDEGVTWTVYNASTATQFKIDGVLDTSDPTTEPTRIAGFTMDRYHVEDRFVFPRRLAGSINDTNDDVVWWSRAGSAGGTSDQLAANTGGKPNYGYMPAVGMFCTKNSLWVMIHPGSNGSGEDLYTRVANHRGAWRYQGYFNDNSSFAWGSNSVVWWEDSDNGSEFLLGVEIVGSTEYYCAVRTDDFDSTSSSSNYSLLGGSGAGNAHVFKRVSDEPVYNTGVYNPLVMIEPGCLLYTKNGLNSYFGSYFIHNLTGSITDGGDQGQSWGAWKTYGWNGSEWVLGDSSPKETHLTSEPLIDGLNISFANAEAGNSFIETEYYDTYVYNGILKDNATTASISHSNSFLEIISTDQFASNVPAVDLGTVTEPVYGLTSCGASNGSERVWHEPGLLYLSSNMGNYASYIRTEQRLQGDFSLSFRVAAFEHDKNVSDGYAVCLHPYATDPTNIDQNLGFDEKMSFDYRWDADSDGDFRVSIRNHAGSTRHFEQMYNWTPDDVFTIERVSGEITYARNGSVFYTSIINNTSDLQFCMLKGDPTNDYGQLLLKDVVATYTNQNNGRFVELGNGVDTGRFDPNFRKVIQDSRIRSRYNEIYIDGVPATINYDFTTPAQGECTLLPYSGRLWFDSADAGAVITGKLGYVQVFNRS